MSAPTVDAYYDAQLNDINFPAGVLLPREQKPQEWARVHLVSSEDQPVYSL